MNLVPRLAGFVFACLVAAGCSTPAAGPAGPGQPVDASGRVGFPLAGPPPNGFATSQDVGSVVTVGQLVVFNLGDKDLELVKVTPQLTGSGLKYLGALAAGPDRELASTQLEPAFPPKER